MGGPVSLLPHGAGTVVGPESVEDVILDVSARFFSPRVAAEL